MSRHSSAPRFILMDPWLCDVGGHNFQYALDVACAAETVGYEVVLGVHRDLPETLRFGAGWQVWRLYRFGTCARHWLGPIGRNGHPCGLDGKRLGPTERTRGGAPGRWLSGVGRQWSTVLDLPAAWDRKRRILDFAAGSSLLLDKIGTRAGDLFFLPSMTEFDFLGVARFLSDDSRTLDHAWHLQFHFNVFLGRDPEFATQADRLAKFQRQLGEARQRIARHRLHLYATTPAMARQFGLVGIGPVEPLPYPVRHLAEILGHRRATSVRASCAPPALSASGGQSERGPLRVTFAGAMRREKGKRKLGSLIAAVWQDYLAAGRVQFVFQSTPRHIARWLPRELRRQARIAPVGAGDLTAPLQTVPYPLDAEAYAELIQSSDLAVFLYDARRYYARASGVLGEMLAAGTPVIVPAGCWLGDQLASAGAQHAASLCTAADVLETRCYAWPTNAGVSGASLECRLHAGVRDVALQWSWPSDWQPGVYLRVRVECGPSAESPSLAVREQILSPGEALPLKEPAGSAEPQGAFLMPCPPGAGWLRVRLESAYDATPVALTSLQVTSLRPPPRGDHRPIGSVGLIASREEDVADLIREVVQHYDHYRAGARRFAHDWLQSHHAARTLEILQRADSCSGLRRSA